MTPAELTAKIADVQNQLETYRRQLLFKRHKTRIICGSIAALGVVCVILAFVAFAAEWDLVWIGGIIAIIPLMIIGKNSAATKYQALYEQQLIPLLLQHFSPDLHYDPYQGITRNECLASTLVQGSIDRYNSWNLISGTYGETQLRFSLIHAEEEHQDKHGSHYDTLFQGVMFIADFNKNFSGHTYVRANRSQKYLGQIGHFLEKHKLGSDQFVELENPDFEKEFAVYTNNQVEARYILSPALIESLLKLKQRCSTETQYSFHDSTITVTIENSSALFTPNFKTPATNNQQLDLISNQLYFFLSIVNDLNLNTRIWSKA
jgi:hypothetical protein